MLWSLFVQQAARTPWAVPFSYHDFLFTSWLLHHSLLCWFLFLCESFKMSEAHLQSSRLSSSVMSSTLKTLMTIRMLLPSNIFQARMSLLRSRYVNKTSGHLQMDIHRQLKLNLFQTEFITGHQNLFHHLCPISQWHCYFTLCLSQKAWTFIYLFLSHKHIQLHWFFELSLIFWKSLILLLAVAYFRL